MFELKTDPQDWANKYGIDFSTIRCPNDCSELHFITPVAVRGYRGLQTESCSICEGKVTRFVPVGKEVGFWNKVSKEFLGEPNE